MIAFIGAMDLEIDEILKLMRNIQGDIIHGVEIYTGVLAGKKCLVMKSGVGKCAAAITTTMMFEKYDIDGVVNIGTAGGLKEEEEVLDVVISEKVAHHDVDVPSPDWPKGFDQDRTCYQADPHYVEVMKAIMDREQDRVWLGNIVTGDCFVYRPDQVERIKKEYPDALCAEMEGAAVAQVCRFYGKPFIIIRSLSDITLKEGNELSFDDYAAKASKRSAKWCESFIKEI